MAYKSLRHCLDDLERHDHLVRIADPVDPALHMAAIQRRLYAAGGPAVLFENVDGSPLDDLQQYRIYVGSSPQSYDQQIEVTDPRAKSQFVALERGEYHVAMTAVDRDGNESGYSNEVVKTVQ
ncbi:MAG: UbiD family decarboxylase [Deltaproteobacteria bacterium]|nr:UbiD family decarboxylase [Deltaproteobacteria bacterium]